MLVDDGAIVAIVSVEDDAVAIPAQDFWPAAEQVKDRQAGLIDDDRLAVDEARLHRQFLDRLDDQVPADG